MSVIDYLSKPAFSSSPSLSFFSQSLHPFLLPSKGWAF